MPRYRRHAEHREHAKLLEQLARETGGDIEEERAKCRAPVDPVDAIGLRGIPVVGRAGAGGHIRGTDPLGEVLRREGRQERRSGR